MYIFLNDNRFSPEGVSGKLTEIFKENLRDPPGQGGEKWSTLSQAMKLRYFDELWVSCSNDSSICIYMHVIYMCLRLYILIGW